MSRRIIRRASNRSRKSNTYSGKSVAPGLKQLVALGVPPGLRTYGTMSPSPFPPTMRVFLVVYGAHYNNTANPGFNDIITTKLNSLKNPVNAANDYAYASELLGIYNKYRIVSSCLSIQTYASTLSNVVIFPSTNNTAVTTIHGAAEHRFAKTTLTQSTGNKSIAELYQTIKCNDLDSLAATDADYEGTGNNDPTNILYWHITSGPFNAGNADVFFRIKLVAEVLFSSLKPSTSSA